MCIFLFGNVYISIVELNFKRHWMSLLWISLVYYKRDMEIIYMMRFQNFSGMGSFT